MGSYRIELINFERKAFERAANLTCQQLATKGLPLNARRKYEHDGEECGPSPIRFA